jgi:anti-anti-sigma regulatory factor
VTDTAGAYGHVCWAYDDPAVFHERARGFLADGLAAGLRVRYAATGHPDAAVERLGHVDGLPEALRRGAVLVVPLDRAYPGDGVLDPTAQVREYASATEEALAGGYAGLRVIADATALVRTPEQRDAFARYEHLVDRYMRTRPMTAMCAYDLRVLGAPAVAELACLHPEAGPGQVPFRLYARHTADGGVALAGDLDADDDELFAATLERVDPGPVGGQLVVDGSDLRFIDHRCLLRLHEHAGRRDTTVVLRTSWSAAARLVTLLDLSRIKVVAA